MDSLHFSDTFESVTDLFSICLKLGGFQNCLKKKLSGAITELDYVIQSFLKN